MKSRVNVITSLLIVAALLTAGDTNTTFGQLPVLVSTMEIYPDQISRPNTVPKITTTLKLPPGYVVTDIENVNLVADFTPGPKGIIASSQTITDENGIVTIVASFGTANLMNNLSSTNYYGQVDLIVEGQLKTGGTFYGEGTITIVQANNTMEISPDKISRQKTVPNITTTLKLPVGFAVNDIATNVNLTVDFIPGPIGIQASSQTITTDLNGIVTIVALFGTADLMNNNNLSTNYFGPVDLRVEGPLITGGTFYGVGTITIVQASDYISDINFDQIWDYGDPTDNTDLMHEFRLEIIHQEADMNDDILRIDFQTPGGQKFEIPKKDNKWPNPLKYKERSTNQADLANYGDGEYTITLYLSDDMQVQTKAWFGNPYTMRPIPQPTQDPNLTHVLQQETEGSSVTFSWEDCNDSSVDDIYMKVLGTFNNGLGEKWQDLNFNQTSWGPLLFLEGSWEAELIFSTLTSNGLHWKNDNDDGISIGVAKSSRCRYRITLEDSPWNIYEVWGGNEELDDWEYAYTDKLEAYGYKRLEGSKKFSDGDDKFDYYLIATKGQCFIESIQGSDGKFYIPINWFDYFAHNIDNENYLFGEPNGLCATFGSENRIIDNDYNGYFVFKDPDNWDWLTIFTCDRNLNLDKSILSVNDETENINPNDIEPNDIITYRISFDCNDFTQGVKDIDDVKDVNNITVVDILPDQVKFVAAIPDSNSYDPIAHTYTWQYPSLEPLAQSTIVHRLIVEVNPDTLPGTTISNFVTIDSDETPPSIASTVASIPYEPLNITKRTIDSAGNEINWIESGKEFIYQICFDNNNNGPQVGDVNLVDLLPFEVTYVDYQSDNPNFSGSYDANDHSFKGTLDALEPGLVTCLKITVEANEDTPNIIINNAVSIDSNETPDANDIIGIEVIPPLEVADVIITPDILSRAGTPQHITAVVKFPTGIQQSDIDPANIPQLYYQDRDTGDFILIGNGSRPVLSGTQITTLFNRAELMDAIYGYGEFTLAVVGQLKSSLTFYGYANIHISKFTGD